MISQIKVKSPQDRDRLGWEKKHEAYGFHLAANIWTEDTELESISFKTF
jgi:hypothetical protein